MNISVIGPKSLMCKMSKNDRMQQFHTK